MITVRYTFIASWIFTGKDCWNLAYRRRM